MSSPRPVLERASRSPSWAGSRLGQLFALVGLTGLAISQPLLSVLGENPSLFVFDNVDGWRITAFALAVAVVPPLVLWLAVIAIGLVSRRVADIVFVGMVAVLGACAAVQLVKWLGLDNAAVAWSSAVVAATALGVAMVRVSMVGEWLRYLAVLPLVAVLLFVFASPSGELRQQRGAVERAGSDAATPVVFLMLDELPTKTLLDPSGGIDRVRFPHLATLADEATWYRNYTVQSGWTEISVPSILSGEEPKGGLAGLWTDYPNTLFSLLAPTHPLTAFESMTELCGFPDCTDGDAAGSSEPRTGDLVATTAKLWRDRVTPGAGTQQLDLGQFGEQVTEEGSNAPDPSDPTRAMERILRGLGSRPSRAQSFLDSLHPDENGLYYLHLLYPHQPWTVGPQGRPYVDDESVVEEPTAWDVALQEQRHIWQTRYTDQVVGQVLDRLREIGLYDRALVVVTADHGVSFDGGRTEGRRVTEDTISDLAYAPLFVKVPGQTEGAVDDSNLTSLDLLPTIADVLGVEIPWAVSGHPADSQEVRNRGETKQIYDFFSPSSTTWDRILEFDESAKPTIDGRAIGPIPDGASPVAGLVATIGLQDELGRPVDELEPTAVATLEAPSLRAFQASIGPYAPVNAVVEGSVSDGPVEGRVLVALNGTIVTAAPLEAGRFRALVPPASVSHVGNAVRAVLLDRGQVTELDLR